MTLAAAALLCTVLAAPGPSVSVVVTRRVGIDPAKGIELAERFSEALGAAGAKLGRPISPRAFAVSLAAANTPDSAACAGELECVVTLGRTGQVDRLVSVQLVKLGNQVGFDASLVEVARGTSVVAVTGAVPLAKPGDALAALAAQLLAGAPEWKAPEPIARLEPPAAPAPPKELPPPAPVAPVPELTAPAAPSRGVPAWAIALDVGGGALVATGAVFGVLALTSYDQAVRLQTGPDAAVFESTRSASGRNALLADVFIGTGTVALAVGLYFTLFHSWDVPVAASVGPNGASLVLGGRF